ncbi:MAG: hypothetical protein HZB26_07925 [Candidatus Hydrogenedentes bacterium]|nr:hypothetical protein [Candidatus Hydrogenedentota bacterium]
MSGLVSLALMLLGAAAPDGIDAYVTLEPSAIPFNKQATYTITVEAPAGAEIKLPDMAGKFGGVDISGPPILKRETLSGNRTRVSNTYTLDPILVKDYFIAAAAIYSNDALAVTVPSPALRVRNLTPEEQEAAERVEPVTGPIDPPNPLFTRTAIVSAAGALALAVAAWFAYRYWTKPKIAVAPPPRPAWERAYERLRELDARQFPQAGQYEPFYVELSDILRHYIEDRFTLHAPERTTPEFLAEASGAGALTDDHQKLLAGFLRHSDRVKFAQFQPTVSEMDHSMSLVLNFIDETVPRPEPAQEEAA